MNASARTARQIIKARRAERAAARKPHTAAGHAHRAGVESAHAAEFGSTIRTRANKLGIKGIAVRMFRRDENGNKLWRNPVKGARRYTRAQIAAALAGYKPRAAKFVTARAQVLAYAA